MNINGLIDETFSGVISIVQGSKSIFQGAYGFADKANEIPNRIDTRFGTASAGKVFVAAAILGLIEQNIISFDTTIGEILKFDLKEIDSEITIRQLLDKQLIITILSNIDYDVESLHSKIYTALVC
jgi:CubicO group peptidase (beta-lactamase class C family)